MYLTQSGVLKAPYYYALTIELVVLLFIGMLFAFHVINKRIIILASLIIFELFFCMFKMLEEMCNLIHLHEVNSLSIKMNDGTTYTEIKAYSEMRNSIRIVNTSYIVEYLSKDAIRSITKILEKKRLIDVVREKSQKQKGSTTTERK